MGSGENWHVLGAEVLVFEWTRFIERSSILERVYNPFVIEKSNVRLINDCTQWPPSRRRHFNLK